LIVSFPGHDSDGVAFFLFSNIEQPPFINKLSGLRSLLLTEGRKHNRPS
jgi:hypothetical protein